MPVQIIFHGINRSPALEAAVNEKVEALRKFDSRLGPCKVTVTQEGHQTMGPLNDAFDTIRRSVVEEGDKRRP